MKLKLHLVVFISLFIAGVAISSVGYLWSSSTLLQLVEDEAPGKTDPTTRKSVSPGEEQLCAWMNDFLSSRALFDHGIEIYTTHSPLLPYTVHLSVESPPPDVA